jgi:hypothetical protein
VLPLSVSVSPFVAPSPPLCAHTCTRRRWRARRAALLTGPMCACRLSFTTTQQMTTPCTVTQHMTQRTRMHRTTTQHPCIPPRMHNDAAHNEPVHDNPGGEDPAHTTMQHMTREHCGARLANFPNPVPGLACGRLESWQGFRVVMVVLQYGLHVASWHYGGAAHSDGVMSWRGGIVAGFLCGGVVSWWGLHEAV